MVGCSRDRNLDCPPNAGVHDRTESIKQGDPSRVSKRRAARIGPSVELEADDRKQLGNQSHGNVAALAAFNPTDLRIGNVKGPTDRALAQAPGEPTEAIFGDQLSD